jgi:hypothetical protein
METVLLREAEALPPAVAAALRPALPEMTSEIIAAVGREVPDYRRPLEGPFGAALTVGVEVALGRFVDLIAGVDRKDDSRREIYVNLGKAEWHAGRALASLLAAYRVGARVAWRLAARAGEAAGIPARTLFGLGEAIFAYIDEISAESVEGYAGEQSAAAGEMQRQRVELARLLGREPAPGPGQLQSTAERARVRLPRSIVAVVVRTTEPAWVAGRLGAEALTVAEGGMLTAWFPAPVREAELAVAVENRASAVGPAVPVAEAARSLRRARAALPMAEEGGGPVMAGDHLAQLLLSADSDLAAELVAHALAPLAGLAAGPRERLTATLRAWVDRPGQVQAVAAELGIHPQTVRYRLRQLRELFGADLEDPDRRFELALALRAHV